MIVVIGETVVAVVEESMTVVMTVAEKDVPPSPVVVKPVMTITVVMLEVSRAFQPSAIAAGMLLVPIA